MFRFKKWKFSFKKKSKSKWEILDIFIYVDMILFSEFFILYEYSFMSLILTYDIQVTVWNRSKVTSLENSSDG